MQVDLMTAFFNQLKILALKDENIFFITADHGAWALSNLKKSVKNQYLNIGMVLSFQKVSNFFVLHLLQLH